jgi:hypothetical protein
MRHALFSRRCSTGLTVSCPTDMEYSDLAGKFSLTPILPEEQDE